MSAIILRELQDYLKSVHFFFLLVFSLALFVTGGVFLGARYDNMVEDQEAQPASTVNTEIAERPSPFLFLAAGFQDNGLRAYSIFPGGNQTVRLKPNKNFMLPEMPVPDWAFIVKCLFSLYVMLFGFNAVSGEKESGTLRQVMSYSLGRTTLAGAKYLSIMLAVSLALSVGCLFGALAARIVSPGVFSLDFILRAAIFFAVSLAWLSLFAFLAVAVSSLIQHSSVSLLALLSVWILFILVIPNLAGPLSEKFSHTPREYVIAQNLGPAFQKKIDTVFNPVADKLRAEGLASEERIREEYARISADVIREYAATFRDYQLSHRRREAVRRSLSRISPASLYQFSVEELAATGFETQETLLRDLREYSARYDSYILEKTGELVPGVDMMIGTSVPLSDGTTVYLRSPQQKEYDGDKSDFPFFQNSIIPLKSSLAAALPDLAGLLAWNIALALAAFWAMRRCDVR